MNKLKILILLGSTRENRFGIEPAKFILEQAKQNDSFDVELVDLRDVKLPFFDEPVSPSMNEGTYKNKEATSWAEKIAKADGFIWITPEYNHSYSAVLKNAIDYVYYEWNKKPVGFVSYGSVGGARAVEHLRNVAAELQMVSLRTAVLIPEPWNLQGEGKSKFKEYEDMAKIMLDQLTWWGQALKEAREK